jgi:hypothetical protein
LALSAALGFSTGGVKSPKEVLSGQIENAGHFLQPTAIAMGQRVMMVLFQILRKSQASIRCVIAR